VFERFTERARQVVVRAQDEARRLKHNYIGTEHLLLGLLAEEEGLANRVLETFGVTLADVRELAVEIVGKGDEPVGGQVPFTPRGKHALELAVQEATALGHNYVGTEHILLGLSRLNEGVAARILLQEYQADAEAIRTRVIEFLGGKQATAPQPPPSFRSELERIDDRLTGIERRLEAIEEQLKRE
jgi:ATP-dependent Clp protease ATP-binding subunit ClpC